MRKLLTYITVATLFLSCNSELETEGISRITYFPEFILEGEDFYIVDPGSTFSEPGIEVLEQGNPINFTTTYVGRYTGYSGTTIGPASDEYNITYYAVNRDGFAASATRTVVAVNTGNFQTSVAGAYLASSVRISGEKYEDVLVLIRETSPGVFEVSDALGGFYTDGRDLGDDYLVQGLEINVNDISSNDFTYESEVSRVDGINMEVSDLVIDPVSKSITFHVSTSEFASGDWDITLTQIQP